MGKELTVEKGDKFTSLNYRHEGIVYGCTLTDLEPVAVCAGLSLLVEIIKRDLLDG